MKKPRKISTNISDYTDPYALKIFKLETEISEAGAILMETEDLLTRYKKAYDILCDETWDFIPDEDKQKIHKKLKELNL